MHNRIKQLLEMLGLKKSEFAASLNLSGPFVSELCSGVKNPSARTITDICAKYNVSEVWLRTGEGEPFLPIDPDRELQDVFTSITLSGADDPVVNLAKSILRKYWTLPDSDKAAVRKFVDGVLEDYKKSAPD